MNFEMLVVILLVSCAAFASSLRNECPPADSMSCSCEMQVGPIVTCSRLSDEEELKSNLAAFKGYKIYQLNVSDITIPDIVDNLYDGLHVNHYILNNIEVLEKTTVEIQYFLGLEKELTTLQISNSFKKEYPLEHIRLDYLNRLEALLMNDNKVSEIGNDWFSTGPKSLQIMTLERNGIERLGDQAFQSLQNLQILWLRGNSFSAVSRSMFPMPAQKLEKIDLSNNKIRELPANLFSDMPALYDVFIGHNQIHTLKEDTFSSNNLQNLRLHVEGNPFKCDSELKWLCDANVNFHTAKCDSPDDRKDLTLAGFCFLENIS